MSRARHERILKQEQRGYQELIKQIAGKNRDALAMTAHELNTAKEVIASHVVAAGHPSTVLHDVRSFAAALEQALTDAGVDLRLELARLEGIDL